MQFTLLNLSSEDKSTIIEKIRDTTQALSRNEQNPSVTLFLQFLSELTFAKDTSEKEALEELFSQCCANQAQKISSHIGMFYLLIFYSISGIERSLFSFNQQ